MFKLVGTETFSVGKNKAACSIKIEPVGGFSYEYSLEVIELVGRLMMVPPGGWETVQEVHREPEQNHEDMDPACGRHHVPGRSRKGYS